MEQLELCGYECEGGPLENNLAFIKLKNIASTIDEARAEAYHAKIMPGGERMSSIGGKYIGIPCGGEKMQMFAKKDNDIDEAQKEALRREGAKAERERIKGLLLKLEDGCPPDVKCCDMDNCTTCYLQYLTEDGQ